MGIIPCAEIHIRVAYLFYINGLNLLIPYTYRAPSFPLSTDKRYFSVPVSLFVLLYHSFVLFLDSQISDIIQFCFLSIWPISLSIIPSKVIDVVIDGRISFFFMTE